MGFVLSFASLYVGYSLLVWGYRIFQHEQYSLWWLMSGKGSPNGQVAKGISGTGGPMDQAGKAIRK